MSETFKDFCLLSLFHITVDILLGCAKYLYHLCFNPTVFPVSNNISWVYIFLQCVLDDVCNNFQENYTLLTNFRPSLRTRVQITYWSNLFFLICVFQFLLLPPHSHSTRKKRRGRSMYCLYHMHYFDHTSFLYLAVPFFSASFFKRSSCHPTNHFHCQLLKSLLFLIRLFDAVTRSEYRDSIPYVNNSIVIFSMLFLFYSTFKFLMYFNNCCACQEKVFIELSTIPRYFPWVVTVHYIRQQGAVAKVQYLVFVNNNFICPLVYLSASLFLFPFKLCLF